MGTRTPAVERMNLLYANDRRGEYPKSWYAATAKPLVPCPALMGSERADVCVIGAGFTGISTALHLAELGYSVTILEAQRMVSVRRDAMVVSWAWANGWIRMT